MLLPDSSTLRSPVVSIFLLLGIWNEILLRTILLDIDVRLSSPIILSMGPTYAVCTRVHHYHHTVPCCTLRQDTSRTTTMNFVLHSVCYVHICLCYIRQFRDIGLVKAKVIFLLLSLLCSIIMCCSAFCFYVSYCSYRFVRPFLCRAENK